MKVLKKLKKWRMQRKGAAEAVSAVEEAREALARLQIETKGAAEEVDATSTQVMSSDINQSCDAATKTETPASNTTTAAPVQTEMSGTVVDEAGEKFARLEDEKSELCLLVNKYDKKIQSLMEVIRVIKNTHSDEVKNLRNKCEVEKSSMRKRMRDMREEILSQQDQLKRKRARRMTESTGSEEVAARGVENTLSKEPSSLDSAATTVEGHPRWYQQRHLMGPPPQKPMLTARRRR
jgi:hypothetical protein